MSCRPSQMSYGVAAQVSMNRVGFTDTTMDSNAIIDETEKSAPPDDGSNPTISQQQQSKPKSKVTSAWYQREDLWVWFSGLLFITVLIGLIWGVGNARGWDADSGFTHNESATSEERFLPEPFIPEEGVRGRYGKDATARWYYWKVKPDETTFWTHFFPWLCYVCHQVLIWATIFFAQTTKAYEQLGKARYRTDMHLFNWIAIGLNVLFHLLHFLNTHTTYDGTAPDVSISTSQGSVIMLLVLVVLLEYRERGLFFGWPVLTSTSKVSTALRFNYGPINLIRRYHGYAFAWAAIYTFWYHPMENTWGHAMGFIYTWIIMLQGSLMYTNLHLNKYWRVFIEVFVVFHGGIVASQTGGPDLNGTMLWPMFVFGFGFCFALTQVYGLPFWQHLPKWSRIFPMLIFAGFTLWAYSGIPDKEGRYWVRITEITRIPAIYYLDFLFGWATLYGCIAIEQRCKQAPAAVTTSPVKQTLYVSGAILVYAAHIALAIAVEYADWKEGLVVLMCFFTIVYTLGAMVSFMLLKQVIPQRVRPAPSGYASTDTITDKAALANGETNTAAIASEQQLCTDL